MDEDEEHYDPLTTLLIWLGLFVLSWVIVIFIGVLTWKFLLWYLPFVMFVWDGYIHALFRLFSTDAE